MQVVGMSNPRARLGLSLVVAAVAMGCRFQAPGAYWIEAHGEGRAVRLAGHPAGVAAIGPDARLWMYPTDYARPWTRFGTVEAKAVAASSAALYAISSNGEVLRLVGNGRGHAYAGSAGWGPSAIAASEDDRVFLVVGGRTRRVEGDDLTDAPCGSVAATAIAASRGDELYVVDGSGVLYRGAASVCAPVATPTRLRDVAAFPGRVVIVGTDGTVWRRRGEQPWQALPAPRKYRPAAVSRPAVQAALSVTSTWLLDQDGAVFVLSDET
jgi:hypothetical protein